MDNDTKFIIAICVFLVCLVTGLPSLKYYLDKSSCYEKAQNYGSKVEAYSWTKGYCFIDMNGKKVNLDNYYDNTQTK